MFETEHYGMNIHVFVGDSRAAEETVLVSTAPDLNAEG